MWDKFSKTYLQPIPIFFPNQGKATVLPKILGSVVASTTLTLITQKKNKKNQFFSPPHLHLHLNPAQPSHLRQENLQT